MIKKLLFNCLLTFPLLLEAQSPKYQEGAAYLYQETADNGPGQKADSKKDWFLAKRS